MINEMKQEDTMRYRQPTLFLGYAAVPNQSLQQVYDEARALTRGTIFPELDLPYGVYGREGYLPW
ncbi:MAG: spore coat associated protein CotJA [Bacillota bacterium]|nr:spore coat associated protein CotJA [Bacillota bacterium]